MDERKFGKDTREGEVIVRPGLIKLKSKGNVSKRLFVCGKTCLERSGRALAFRFLCRG